MSRKDIGASVPDQALAVPATPASAVDGPSGFDPSRAVGPGTIAMLRDMVAYEIAAGSSFCSTMVRAGLLLDLLDEVTAHRAALAKARGDA